jgi:oligopeptide transport system substrate-binding protein
MKLKKLFAVAFALSICASSLSGCGSSNGNTASPSSASGSAASQNVASSSKKQEITWALQDEPETMDPSHDNYLLATHLLLNLFSGLFKIDKDNKLQPAVCDSYKVDSTNTVYTFKIKSSAKWSDGKPVKAADFVYSWKRTLNPATASEVASDFFVIKGAEAYNSGKGTADAVGLKAIDDQTLQVTLEKPNANFLYILTFGDAAPLREDIIEANKDWTKSPSTYISDGPFMLTDFEPKSKYVLKKNPNYFDAANVKLDTLNIVFISSTDSEIAAYTSDEIDIDMNLDGETLQKYKDTPDFHSVSRIGTGYFDFNCSSKPFTDAKVRKAFSMAINRKQIIENVLQSTEKPATGEVPFGVLDPSTGKDFRDTSGNLITEDVNQAKKLLSDAGYADGKGMPTITLVCKANDADKDVAQALQSMWKTNLGVDVNIQTFDSKVYWNEVHQGNFTIATDGWTADYPDPYDHLFQFITSANAKNNRWSNADYDKLIEDSTNTTDAAKRSKDFVDAEKILADESPIMPVRFYVATYLAKPSVKGMRSDFSGHLLFENAYVE